MRVAIRSEAPGDALAIDSVVAAAFRNAPHTSHTEQFVVRALRASGRLTLSLVAESGGTLVGHVAISPVSISDASRVLKDWYGLGPVAVAPDQQRRGIGSALVRQSLQNLRTLGGHGCVVLGDPRYYGRFGFRAEPSLVFPGVPPEYFQALSFDSALPSGIVMYDEAFAASE
jgi:putative acetyltransferase